MLCTFPPNRAATPENRYGSPNEAAYQSALKIRQDVLNQALRGESFKPAPLVHSDLDLVSWLFKEWRDMNESVADFRAEKG